MMLTRFKASVQLGR